MAKELVFIGGPADGKREMIGDKIDIAYNSGAKYVRKSMACHDEIFECFTFGEMRSFEVLEKLFEGYKRA